ncbi:MAG: tetrahydromethanopterin S-methyltransferase subunit [Methanobacterium sp.]|jgi:tetrahydromethanopterin S-methyltransferase subunit D|uniref:tetrahydromethanopterin S-methyltransferase subunit D n=1 Tax=Methanobacterium sp. TaxID=2164 RepID=UPI0003C98114|nr:tetrahydromethanopterin S-methyltransferase subunit D [Methanobacterium sp.]MDI3549701.1 tetrahydromethanopterin S-methyltransferase subunit [Methanobacterium sp.]CDG65771.1 Tetrahydromethanopterin S-methyltransferase subunit D [Methanobacterium sp. MB1]
MDPLLMIGAVTAAGILIGGGVHFLPVGGAPAAIATATGVGTGTAMLAAGSAMTGLITAAAMTGSPLWLILASGAVGSMLMIGITMLVGNWVYVWGVGTVPASAKVEIDPITKYNQEKYVTPGTEGHGIPTVCYISGIIGGLLGGIGGGLAYWAIYESLVTLPAYAPLVSGQTSITAAMVAGMFALGLFFVNSVIASYNIGGTIEGFHDPKFKRIPRGIVACLLASIVVGLIGVLLLKGGVF